MIDLAFPLGRLLREGKKWARTSQNQHFLLLIKDKFCEFRMTFRSG